MRKNDALDAKIVNMRLTKTFIAIFAPDERLPSSATLIPGILSLRDAIPAWLRDELLQPFQLNGRIRPGQRPRLHWGHQQLHLHSGGHLISHKNWRFKRFINIKICQVMIFHFYFHFHKNLPCHDFSLTALNCELRHLLNTRGNKKKSWRLNTILFAIALSLNKKSTNKI